MNIFGYHFLTPKEFGQIIDEAVAAAADEIAAQQLEELDDPTMLESAKFARKFNQGTAAEVLRTIKKNGEDADRFSKMALYVSIPHQAIFLLSLVPLAFGNVIQVFESIALLWISLTVPFLGDRLILMSIRNLSTRVISTWDKCKAFGTLIPATALSIYLNVMAPGPDLLKYACGVLVAFVPMYQIIRSVRPNFKKAGADETKIRNEIESLVVTNQDTGKAAHHVARGQKAAATRAANKERKIEEAKLAAQAAAQAAIEAAKEAEQRKEANRQRGLAAAATRAARKIEAERLATEAAQLRKRPSRAKAKVEA